jgi:Stage II sporulation protein E (SpoIIE)/GAF domain
VYANRAALAHLGFDSVAELRTRPTVSIMDDYVVEDEFGRPLGHDDVPSVRLLAGEPAEPLLMRVVNRETGELRWNLLKTTALRVGGEFLGAMTVIEDVTAVKTAEIRTRVLAESGRALTLSADYEQTLRNVAGIAVPLLADYCAVDLVSRRGLLERIAAWHDLASVPASTGNGSGPEQRFAPGPVAARVLGSGLSELYHGAGEIAEHSQFDEHLRMLAPLGLRSLVLVPLRVSGRTIGLMTLATHASLRRFEPGDVELAEQLGRRAAVAIENSRLHAKLTEIADTLQRALLPGPAPEVPGWEIASLYRPADAELRVDVGGDFYDFFEHHGTWAAILGDVTGKGVTAAAGTALLRHGARVAARTEPEPAAILGRLHEALAEQPGTAMASAICMRLHPDRVLLSSAGHPPAIVIGSDGSVREVPEPGPILGAFPDSSWRTETAPMGPGDLLVLVTDGVLEAPGRDGRFGPERLRGLLAGAAGCGPESALAKLDAALWAFSRGETRDDIAALAFQPRP